MFTKPSIITRVAAGKLTGFVIGLSGFLLLPYFLPEPGWLLRWGILLWYTTVGGLIGICGVITYHPVIRLPMPWWFIGPLLGAWMNFVLVFFAYDLMEQILLQFFEKPGVMTSPFWFVLEGAVIGLIIGWVATRLGGEGKATLAGME